MKPITIVKLGGSAITDKSKDCRPNLEVIHNCADEVASYCNGTMILLHGGGSYAHPTAMRWGLAQGYRSPTQLRALSEIELQLEELSRIVSVALFLRKVRFVPIRPMSFMILNSGRVTRSFLEPIICALKLGITPLIHGDVVFDRLNGFGIVSADKIASFLAKELPISRVLFGSDVDGIYTSDPKTSRKAELLEEVKPDDYDRVLRKLQQSSKSDASQGMYGKVREAIVLARLGCSVHFFNLRKRNNLRNLLANSVEFEGTKIRPIPSTKSAPRMND